MENITKDPQSSSQTRDFLRSSRPEKLRSEENQSDKQSGKATVTDLEKGLDEINKNLSTVLDEKNKINPIKDIRMIKELLNSCQSSHLEELEAKSDALLFSTLRAMSSQVKVAKFILCYASLMSFVVNIYAIFNY